MKPKPDERDRALFREATQDVKPLRHAPRVTDDAPKPRGPARFGRAKRQPPLEGLARAAADEPELAAGDASSFTRPGVSQVTLRQLRRGQYRIQGELDLHGLTVAQATLQLQDFLGDALQHGARSVRIVHGKGLRSGSHGPVLRQLVNSVLRRTPAVLAFTSARQADGGTGALYVLLATAQASSASTTAE